MVGHASKASLEASDTAKRLLLVVIVQRPSLGDARKAEADRLTSRVVRAEVNLIVECAGIGSFAMEAGFGFVCHSSTVTQICIRVTYYKLVRVLACK